MGTQRHVIRHYKPIFACAALVGLSLMITACAQISSEPSARTMSGQATPIATSFYTARVTQTPSSGTAQIGLLLGAGHYTTSDAITVTIRNNTSTTAYVIAHFTDCSVILVERSIAGSWQPIHLCATGYPHPVLTQIAPGTETVVEMYPTSASSDAQADAPSHWLVGTYRAALTYTSSQSAAFAAGSTIFSTTFVVG